MAKEVSIRDNLLVTMGTRAAYMDCLGTITLPSGVGGETQLAEFVSETVDQYIDESLNVEWSFDEYIETALEKKYGVKEDE